MMEIAREAELIPPEQFAERQSDGQDGVWFKKLLADISRQAKLMAMGWISANAGNCYDRIAHAFASLVFQAFGVFISAVMATLCTIQTMKFYLRTGFGESPGFHDSTTGDNNSRPVSRKHCIPCWLVGDLRSPFSCV
jgi:hypothetical protein